MHQYPAQRVNRAVPAWAPYGLRCMLGMLGAVPYSYDCRTCLVPCAVRHVASGGSSQDARDVARVLASSRLRMPSYKSHVWGGWKGGSSKFYAGRGCR